MLPEIDYKKIGDRVRKARLDAGITQAQLAERIDCSNNYISHIETGQTKVSLTILMQISYVLEKPLDFFVTDTPYVATDYLIENEISKLIKSCDRSTLITAKHMLELLIKHQNDMKKEYLG